MEKYSDTVAVQMDSVIGSKGVKVVAAHLLVSVSLMLGFLPDVNISRSEIDIYDGLYQ